MQSQTITVLHRQPQVLRLRTEAVFDSPSEKPDIQPVIDRLRIIYLQHLNLHDELSMKIQEVAEDFICIDCSKITQLSDFIKVAQDCRNQFAQVLCNDFDQALLKDPVIIRGRKFEKWQLIDYINLDKYFGQRQVAISPFDQQPFPEVLPRHEFVQAILDLLKTIPEFPEEIFTPQLSVGQQALVANQAGQYFIAFPSQGNGVGGFNQQELINYTPENNLLVAYSKYQAYKKMAKGTMQLEEKKVILVQLEIDIAARKLTHSNFLEQIINQEAQRMLAYAAEREQIIDAHLEEAQKAHIEITELKEKLDASTTILNKLRADLTVEEKRSADLQQQIYVEQTKYIHLAQQIQEIRQRCKKRPWWKFW
jgi:hypothetical protein